MKERIELVIFDMDGLMVDTESICIKAWNRVFDRYNLKVDKDFYYDIIGSSAKVLEEKMSKRGLLGEGIEFDIILNEQRKEAADIVDTEGIERKEGVLELIDYLEKNNIKKAVASSSFRTKVDKFLKLASLDGKFDYIIAGDEVLNSKPAPDLYINVCEHFGIEKDKIIILEDSKNGLTAAKNADIAKRIYIPDIVILTEEEEENLSFRKFSSLLEVKEELEKTGNLI